MIEIEPTTFHAAIREWYEYERDGRYACQYISFERWKQELRFREIEYVRCNSSKMIRERLELTDRSRIRMGARGRTVAQWHRDNEANVKPSSQKSIAHFKRLISATTPIESKGMLLLVKPSQAELFVIEGFHRSAAWCALCERGMGTSIVVNIAFP